MDSRKEFSLNTIRGDVSLVYIFTSIQCQSLVAIVIVNIKKMVDQTFSVEIVKTEKKEKKNPQGNVRTAFDDQFLFCFR